MSRWRGDKRQNKRRLSLWESVGDAYLISVESCVRTIICDLPKRPKDAPLPRLLGWTANGGAVALIPGDFIERSLNRKGGFSETEQYLKVQSTLLAEDAPSVIQVLWDPASVIPVDRIEHLRQRLDVPLKHVSGDELKNHFQTLREYAEGDTGCQENWFLESWRWIANMEESTAK